MVACCAEKSYSATTIADLVARAAVSRTTFYKLFADKRDCFDAAVAHCLHRLAAAVAGAALEEEHDSPAAATRAAATAALDLLAAEPELAIVLSGDVVGVDPRAVDHYAEAILPPLEALWTSEEGPARKHLSPGIALGRAQLLIFHELAAGRAERLPELVGEVVYLAVAPFAGHDEAVRQARIAAEARA
jgi:AcrR family transcriptional regulator